MAYYRDIFLFACLNLFKKDIDMTIFVFYI